MAAIIQINTSNALQDAIQAIASNAGEDSLLRDPFDETLDIAAFVDPLTTEEKQLIVVWRAELAVLKEERQKIIDFFSATPDDLPNFPQFVALEDSIRELSEKINLLVKKGADALAAYLQEVERRRREFGSDRSATLQELSDLIDKFELFRTEGLYSLLKFVEPETERLYRNFIEGAPEILFISEYVVDGKFVGALLCFEKHAHATHYEILKKNLFQSNSDFERILVLGISSLTEETSNFMPYIKDVLGFGDIAEDKVFLILDTLVKEDRIYDYKIKAARVPQNANQIDYDLILESKGSLFQRSIPASSTYTLFQYAGVAFGNEGFAWILALVNEGITFFGRTSAEASLVSVMANPEFTAQGNLRIDGPNNIDVLMSIVRESMSIHGTAQTFVRLLRVLGGAPPEFLGIGGKSPPGYDQARNVFSYDAFRQEITKDIPVLQLVLEIAETQDVAALQELSKLSIRTPMNTGSENLTTVLGLTRVFTFLNDTFIAISYAQDPGTFEKLKQIRALIEINRDGEDTLESASGEERDDVASQTVSVEDNVGTLLNISNGEGVDSDQEAQDDSLGNNPMAILPTEFNG